MKKIITAFMVLLFSFGVVGSVMATGDDCRPTSCYTWCDSYSEGKYVAASDGYHDDGYKDGSSSSSYDGYKDGSSSSSYDSEHDSEHDKSSSY
jgi:hypothetical protein